MRSEITCMVTGRVQDVTYRGFVQQHARTLEVVGFARNCPDGSVEVVAQGTNDALRQFIEKLNEGSVRARVDNVAVEWRSSREYYDDFCIIY